MTTDINNYLNVNNYTVDGFKKVCDVIPQIYNNFWAYENVNETLMFDPHKSWVYFIVDKDEIVKVGETGNPLGIRKKLNSNDNQPQSGSTSRFGRYINGDGTDYAIRTALNESVYNGTVSLWAKKCDYVQTSFSLWGAPAGTAVACVHKDIELKYIDFIKQKTGNNPILNKSRK
jgi:hypothetical protein